MRSPMAVIALMAHDRIPGTVFAAHPQRLVDVMAASGRFKARVYSHAGPGDRLRQGRRRVGEPRHVDHARAGGRRLIGEWDEVGRG